MRTLIVAWFAAGSLLAQFQDLATPDDGSALYFSSTLRLSGSTQFLHAKLFLMDPTGIHLYAQQAPGDSLGNTTTNFYQLAAADVSADGKILAYTASRPCYGGSGCLSVEQHQGHIVGLAGQPDRVSAGYVRISRNGRYALYFGRTAMFPAPSTQWIDLQSGESTILPSSYNLGGANGRRRIALDGTVVVSSGNQLALWRKSGVQTLSNSDTPIEPMLNDAATLVVYQSTGDAPKLIAYDVKSGRETTLATRVGSESRTFGASMTGDGTLILFLNHNQAWLVRSDGTGLRQLSQDRAGIVEAVLTGNGRFVYAVTGEGRMIRIDAGSGDVLELVSRTPSIASVDAAAAGTLVRLTGTGLVESTEVGGNPLPDTLAGAQAKLGGVPMPLALFSPTEIRLQVPWEWPAGQAPFELLSGTSPFVSGPDSLTVDTFHPRFYENSWLDPGLVAEWWNTTSLGVVAVHAGWDALVTDDKPAQAGEVIHLYLGGLGPVSPRVPTGMPGPADPVARVVTPPHCQLWDGGPNEAQVPFAGLAPGMVGIYQLELLIPAGLRITPVSLTCGYDSDPGIQAIGLLPVAQPPR